MALDDLYASLPPTPALGPQDLGVSPLGPAPAPPQAQHPDMIRRILPLIAAAIAAKAGPGAGTGIAQGVLHASAADATTRHQQQQIDEQNFRYQQQTYAQQQREYDADVNRRQQLVQANIQSLREKALRNEFDTQDDLNRYARVYAQGLQSQGVRGVTPEFLIKAVPFYAKSERKQLWDSLTQTFKLADEHNTEVDPKGLQRIVLPDGTVRHVPTLEAIKTVDFPVSVDGYNGSLKKIGDKALTPAQVAGEEGAYQDVLKQLLAVPGTVETPELRMKARTLAKKALADAGRADRDGPRDRFSVQPITNPDGSISLLRVNVDTGTSETVPMPTGTSAGRATDTQRLSRAYLDRSIAADAIAKDFEQNLSSLGSQFDVRMPNLLQSEEGQRYKDARDEFINAALRRESGAAIQPSEYARFEKIYFVMPGDTARTIRQKQEARARVLAGFRTTAGAMGTEPPAAQTPTSDPAASALDKLRQR